MYKDKNIQKLVDELDIVQVIGEYVMLKKTGSNYRGYSPFKDERTPSFFVSPVKKIFKDFGTGIGGDVITFYMKINNLTFAESINELSRKYDISIGNYTEKKEYFVQNAKYYEIMEEAKKFFKSTLLNSEEALQYMENRGYSVEDIQRFEIGFSGNGWQELFNYLKEKGYSEEDMLELGLVKKNANNETIDYFIKRVMFPIYNKSMKVVGFGGRIIEENSKYPKYLNSPDSKIFKKGSELFGLTNRGENIRKKGLAILMEGYLDVLTSHKYTFNNSVASLGTAFTDEQAKLLKNYTQNVIIAYDNDGAGKEAIKRAGNILKKYDFNVRCLSIDKEEKDPDEYLRKYGKKQFLEILKSSKTLFDFLFEEFSSNLNLNDISGKKEMIERFRPFLTNITNKAEVNLYIQKLAVELNIDKDVLYSEYLEEIKKNSYNNRYSNIKSLKKEEKVISKVTKEEKYTKLEKETLKFMLKYGDSKIMEQHRQCKMLENKVIENIVYGEIFEKLKDINFDIKKIDNLAFEEEEKEIITTLKLQAEIDILNNDKQYKDIFVGWFLREIELMREIIEKRSEAYVKLQLIKSELKVIHNISEIEEMYKQFRLIRRPEYV